MDKYWEEQIQYLTIAMVNGIEGEFNLQFIVYTDGTISDKHLLRE